EADARVRQARAALLPSASVGGFWLNRTFNSRSIGISFPGFPELIGPFNNYDARVSARSEEHTSELQSLAYLVCRLLPEKKKDRTHPNRILPTCISSDLSNAYAQPTPQHTPYKNPIHFAEADPLGLRLSFLLDPLIVATC